MSSWGRFKPHALLRRLAAAEVDFVVVGGVATILHGGATSTQDLDIVYAGDEANLERLGGVLVALDARLRGVAEDVPFIPDGRTLRRTQILTLETPDGPLDLLVRPGGSPAYDTIRERADRATIDGTDVRFAGIDDLIAMKRAASRPKDLIAIEELEAIKRLRRELEPG